MNTKCQNLEIDTVNYRGPDTKYTYCYNTCQYNCPRPYDCNGTCSHILYSNLPTLPPQPTQSTPQLPKPLTIPASNNIIKYSKKY